VYFAGDVPIVYSLGDRVRFTVLEAAPPGQFERVLKLLQPVVDSFRITGH
jgi:hypothetical protein